MRRTNCMRRERITRDHIVTVNYMIIAFVFLEFKVQKSPYYMKKLRVQVIFFLTCQCS